MATRPLMLGYLVVIGAVLCACSSGASAAQSAPPAAPATTAAAANSSPTAASAATPAASPAGADQLRPVVLQATDLPTGWSGTPYKADPTGPDMNATFAACMGVRNTTLDKAADVHSQDFAMGTANIASEAASYPTAVDLAADVSTLTNAKYSSCAEAIFRAALGKTLPAGATISGVDVKVNPGAGAGPSNVAGTVAIKVTIMNSGLTQTIYSTMVVITGPLIEAQIEFTDSGQPFPAALQATLVGDVAARAARA